MTHGLVGDMSRRYCREIMPMCDVIMKDGGLSCTDTILPPLGCYPGDWGDGTCNPACGTLACAWDGGDCPIGLDMALCDYVAATGKGYALNGGECSAIPTQSSCDLEPQCRWENITSIARHENTSVQSVCVTDRLNFFSNGKCDLKFNTSGCAWDNGECTKCSWDDPAHNCIQSNVGDGYCDADCHTADCGWDGGDCPALVTVPAPGTAVCPAQNSFLGNNNCDLYFNTETCGCDLGDCQDDLGFIGKRVPKTRYICTAVYV
jgi:hypothetical protein